MHDRQTIRRRRATLAVFMALSIAILTAYFGESSGGFFHALQRGAQEAFAPIETGASHTGNSAMAIATQRNRFFALTIIDNTAVFTATQPSCVPSSFIFIERKLLMLTSAKVVGF